METAEEQVVVQNAFSRALGREMHVLSRQPKLLWQQMYNRLQWEWDTIKQMLALEFAQRKKSTLKPWFHNKIKTKESEAFIRLVGNHTRYVNACAFSPDGCMLTTASDDKTLRMWDIWRCEPVHTFQCAGDVKFCDYNSSGNMLAACDEGGKVYIFGLIGFKLGVIICTALQGKQVFSFAARLAEVACFCKF